MAKKKIAFRYKNVMLIDDNELDNFINQKIIAAHHFAENTYTATNGQSAIDFLRNLPVMGREFYPEVIFIDLNMPLMDGYQFLEYCRSEAAIKDNNIKLVVLTSSVNDDDRKKVTSRMKEVLFLNKPLTQEILSKIG